MAGLIGSNSSDDAALPLTDIRVTLDTGVLLSSSTNTSVSLPTPFRDNLFKNQQLTVLYNVSDEVRRDLLDPFPAEMRTITSLTDSVATLSSALVKDPSLQQTNYSVQSIASSVFGASGSWSQTSGRFILTVASGKTCLLYTSPSPRDKRQSRMPSSA